MPNTPPEVVEVKHRPATALIAYVNSMSMEEKVEITAIDRLVDAICGDAGERVALISALEKINNAEIAILLREVIARRAARLKSVEENLEDLDEVVGLWSQRLTAGGVLAGIGAAIAGVLTGGAAIAAIAVPALAGGIVAAGRLRVKKRRSEAARARESTESLCERIREVAARRG